MKLIIDISEETYEFINVYEFMDDDYIGKLAGAITNGTPIPDNATVCDIEQIRDEIEKERDKVYQNRQGCDTYYADGLDTALEIIDKYIEGGKE